MKFLFSKNSDYQTHLNKLSEADAVAKARLAWVKSIGARSEAIKQADVAATRAMAADPNDDTVGAFIRAHQELRSCDDWHLAMKIILPVVVGQNEKMLTPLTIATLKALIIALEKKRDEIMRDERALAEKHGEDFDESASPRVRRIDADTREAQNFLDRLNRGEPKLVEAAKNFCLRDCTPQKEKAPLPSPAPAAQVQGYQGAGEKGTRG
jgi:hypothetical protein